VRERPGRRLAEAAAAGAAFGAAVGSYVGGWQILYAAVKMPLFLLATGALCAAAVLAVSAVRAPPAEAASVALECATSTTRMLAALAPPLFLAGVSMPKPEPRGYAAMVLLLTAAVALAGTISVARLRRDLRSTPLWLAWIALYGFTGAQMAWLLKPWIGHTLNDDRFLPLRENLGGNFYEAAWGTLRCLMR
jgi:hypothetical protein